ncbi:MAG TPA: HDOD domain-containing protein [Spirochaetota bacterium]|nr:HDOD domain-containing protein [Spirochaetota bacterium]HPI89631.1 HDOD domain-containing protein [Spirochaetota bacterium]HPR49210.1 HDOD domain-containing protein [Spirochaetota bacterium]
MSVYKTAKAEIGKKIEKDEALTFRFKFINEDLLMLLNSIMAKLLGKMDFIFLLNSTITILREVVVNALKANAKRVFFKKEGLDISRPEDYEEGMRRFKDEVIGVFDVIEKDLVTSEYYIKLHFERKEGNLIIRIINNAPILPEELERINFRMTKAAQYNDFSEVYEEIEDSTEGAGLGIVLTVLFLKNMGIPPSKFTIKSDKALTITTLIIPKILRPVEITTEVKIHILHEIEGLPTFPENIVQLQRLCNDPDSSIDEISRRIKVDPALTTDVIKLSNSAGFVPGKRIENINEAVMTIGLKNLNAILVASNARRILDKRYTKYEQIWEHCNKTAYYARNIALTYRLSSIVEYSFMAGLLHDLGKIILLSTDMTLVTRIATMVENRKIVTSTIMEEISIGISHSSIGAMISEKWNFPSFLIEAIRFHHAPLNASKEFMDIVYIVYLANMLCGIEDRKYSYTYCEESVLERFNLDDEKKFKELHEKLKYKYNATRQ